MLNTAATLTISNTSSWNQCLQKIADVIGPSNFETWFRTIDFFIDNNGNTSINVPNQFFADFIDQNFSAVIKNTLQEFNLPHETVNFIPVERDWKVFSPPSQVQSETNVAFAHKPAAIPLGNNHDKKQFHFNYTFDKYVIGDSNRMAHAASLAVAEAPGKTTFNPLVIYGGTGLGKTHLLQAIGQFALVENTVDHVLYMTSEDFTNQYINYVVHKKDSTSFYKTFLNVDLLLIDDIQFFSGKPGTQKEFFRIFNKLLLENKQIVLTSDRPPEKITDMMSHIINRFLGGLISDIQPPNLETRIAILKKKADLDGLLLPEEVLQYIAGQSTSNVRELEGMLIKLIASSTFTGRDISIDVAKEICGDVVQRKDQRLTTRIIQEKVAELYNISPNQLSAHTRKRDVTLPRNIAMYLCKKWTKQSLRTIGLDFGGRDYSTVIHANKKIEEDMISDSELRENICRLDALLEPLARC